MVWDHNYTDYPRLLWYYHLICIIIFNTGCYRVANSIRRVFMSEVPTIGKIQTISFFTQSFWMCLLTLPDYEVHFYLLTCFVFQLSTGFRSMPTLLYSTMSLLLTEWVRISTSKLFLLFYFVYMIKYGLLKCLLMLAFDRFNSAYKWWHCRQDAILTCKFSRHEYSF